MLTSINEAPGNRSLPKETPEDECSFLWSMPKYKLRKVSASRDFPPGCGLNVQLENSIPEEMKMDVGLLGVTLYNGLETNIVDTQKEAREAGACRGRVSAIRDFPPLCGTIVLQEFNDEHPRVAFGNLSLVGIVNAEAIETLNQGIQTRLLGEPSLSGHKSEDVASVESMGTLVSGDEELGVLKYEQVEEFDTFRSKSPENIRGQKEIALYTLDKNSEARLADNVLHTVSPVTHEIVQGLMAEPYCPWKHRKSGVARSVSRTTEGRFKWTRT